MSVTITKFKPIFAWNDDKKEQWLQEMAAQGWHLRDTRLATLSWYTFERGEPAAMAYRLDFIPTRIDPHYHQLFIDAGWELVTKRKGWYVWRKPRVPGQTQEIFTDTASRARKYLRLNRILMVMWVLLLSMNLFTLLGNPDLLHGVDEPGVPLSVSALAITWTPWVLLSIAIWEVRRRIRQIRSPGA